MAQEKEPKFEELLGRFALMAYGRLPELTVGELVRNLEGELPALKGLPEDQLERALEAMLDEKVREKRAPPPPAPPKPPEKVERKRERKPPEKVKAEREEFLRRWFELLG